MEPTDIAGEGTAFFSFGGDLRVLETAVLPDYIPRCRWFAGKGRGLRRFQVIDLLQVTPGAETTRLACIQVEYQDGGSETYLLPLQVVENRTAEAVGIVAQFSDGSCLADAIHDESFRQDLLRLILSDSTMRTESGVSLRGIRGSQLTATSDLLPAKVLAAEQSNTSIVYGDQIFLKLFRKLEEGLNPDVEITRYLTEQQQFPRIPPYFGSIELQRPGREPQVLAVALGLIPNHGDAWKFTLERVEDFLRRVKNSDKTAEEYRGVDLFGTGDGSHLPHDLLGTFAARARQLGNRTGELHLALARDSVDPAFSPEPFTDRDQHAFAKRLDSSIEELRKLVVGSSAKAGVPDSEILQRLNAAFPKLKHLIEQFRADDSVALKTRIHGDYHLGQVLNTGDDFFIIDFEGEPLRSLEERRKKQSPLRDVAGMLRSFHYAAHSGLNEFPTERAFLEPWAELWSKSIGNLFLRGWLDTVGDSPIIPRGADQPARLLRAFLLEKAIYEVKYELNNRPTWLPIPIRGILQLITENI